MAELEYLSISPITTEYTYNSTANWQDVTNATLTGFTTSTKYLILVSGIQSGSDATYNYSVRLVHGATPTAFAESEKTFSPRLAGDRFSYFHWEVWTAASGEDVKLQVKTSNTTGVVGLDQVCMYAVDLSSLTENTHYWHHEVSNPGTDPPTISTSWQSAATEAITTSSGDDLLVLGRNRVTNTNSGTRINGGLYEGAYKFISVYDETGGGSSESVHASMGYVAENLTAATHTFEVHAQLSAARSAEVWESSTIFVADLAAFDDFTAAVDLSTANALSGTEYATQVATITHPAPPAATDVLYLAFVGQDTNNLNGRMRSRIQKDNTTDLPSTENDYISDVIGTAEQLVIHHMYMDADVSSSVTIDHDASRQHSACNWQYSTLLAIEGFGPPAADLTVDPAFINDSATYTPTLQLDLSLDAGYINDSAVYVPKLHQQVRPGFLGQGATNYPDLLLSLSVAPGFISDSATYTPTFDVPQSIDAEFISLTVVPGIDLHLSVTPGFINDSATYTPALGLGLTVSPGFISDSATYTPSLHQAVVPEFISGTVVPGITLTLGASIDPAFINDASAYTPSVSAASPGGGQATVVTVVQTTRQEYSTNDTTWHDISGASITSGSITAGNRYIVLASARYRFGGSGTGGLRLVHGSTAFPGAIQQENNSAATTNHGYFGVWAWTAVSTEDVKFQFRKTTGNTTKVFGDELEIIMVDADDSGLTEDTDFGFAEATASNALDTANDWTHTNDATDTFTAEAGDYLVICTGQIDNLTTSNRGQSRITRSGEASSNTSPIRMEGGDATNGLHRQVVGKVFTLGAASNTFTQESSCDASTTGYTREYSSVFWLKLDAFQYHLSDVTAGSQTLDATAWNTQLATVTFNPTTKPTKSLFFKFTQVDGDKGLVLGYSRMQGGGVDWPSTETLEFSKSRDAVDVIQHPQIHYEGAINASTAVDVDAYVDDASNTPIAVETTLLALSLELAGGGLSVSPGFINDGAVYVPQIHQAIEPGYINDGTAYTPTVYQSSVSPGYIADGTAYTPSLQGQQVSAGYINDGAAYTPSLVAVVSPDFINDGETHHPDFTIEWLVSGGYINDGAVYTPSLVFGQTAVSGYINDGTAYTPTLQLDLSITPEFISATVVPGITLLADSTATPGLISDGAAYTPAIHQSVTPGYINDGATYSPSLTLGLSADPDFIVSAAIYPPTVYISSVTAEHVSDGVVYTITLQSDKSVSPGHIADGAAHIPAVHTSVVPGYITDGATYTPTVFQSSVTPSYVADGVAYSVTLQSDQSVTPAFISDGAAYTPSLSFFYTILPGLISDGETYALTVHQSVTPGLISDGVVNTPLLVSISTQTLTVGEFSFETTARAALDCETTAQGEFSF